MHLREEGLKENYLIPTNTVASMVGKVVIAEKNNMEVLSIQYQDQNVETSIIKLPFKMR